VRRGWSTPVRATTNPAWKSRSFSRDDRTVCVGADKSEHCREFKEMIFHFAHRSSNPLTMQSSPRSAFSDAWEPANLFGHGNHITIGQFTQPEPDLLHRIGIVIIEAARGTPRLPPHGRSRRRVTACRRRCPLFACVFSRLSQATNLTRPRFDLDNHLPAGFAWGF
jgi:hypothetical protein